jgi:hypothetical protein
MKHESIEKEFARRSAQVYIPLTLSVVGLFLLAALLYGGYPLVARLGGAVWIGLLTLIVTMPVVTSKVKKHTMRK